MNPQDVIHAIDAAMDDLESRHSHGVGPGPWEKDPVWQGLEGAKRQMEDFYGKRPDWAATDPILHEELSEGVCIYCDRFTTDTILRECNHEHGHDYNHNEAYVQDRRANRLALMEEFGDE